jgi:GTPase SAR1 family protein
MYFRDTDAAIIVYDVMDRNSLEMVKNVWLPDLQEKAPENVVKVIIGNKCDMVPKNTDGDYDSLAGGVSEQEG